MDGHSPSDNDDSTGLLEQTSPYKCGAIGKLVKRFSPPLSATLPDGDSDEPVTDKHIPDKVAVYRDGYLVECPLSRALQSVLDIGTTDTKQLSKRLHLSKHTINSQFKEINYQLGTHGRDEAVILALR
jgi:hypothetical protein